MVLRGTWPGRGRDWTGCGQASRCAGLGGRLALESAIRVRARVRELIGPSSSIVSQY